MAHAAAGVAAASAGGGASARWARSGPVHGPEPGLAVGPGRAPRPAEDLPGRHVPMVVLILPAMARFTDAAIRSRSTTKHSTRSARPTPSPAWTCCPRSGGWTALASGSRPATGIPTPRAWKVIAQAWRSSCPRCWRKCPRRGRASRWGGRWPRDEHAPRSASSSTARPPTTTSTRTGRPSASRSSRSRRWLRFVLDTPPGEPGHNEGNEIEFALRLLDVDRLAGRTILDCACSCSA